MIAQLAFAWFLTLAILTLNALRPPGRPGGIVPSLWISAMLVSESAPVLFVSNALVGGLAAAWYDGSDSLARMTMGLFTLTQLGLSVLVLRAIAAARATGHPPSLRSLLKIWERRPEKVQRHRRVPYWGDLTLDVYTSSEIEAGPTLIYLHPGSWMRGRPGRHARPLIHRLARHGWVVLDIEYPLSPAATFPAHLIGVKRAIAWARDEGLRFGVDPQRIVMAGASSGAHLAALAALTPDRPALQPDFETADVSVAACVVFYGVYDLFVRNPTRDDWAFISRDVMKADRTDQKELYRLASPLDQVRADAPPFLVVHGEFDSLVLPAESRIFADTLSAAGGHVTYHEVKGAQHGFDALAALRSRAVGAMTASWLQQELATPSPVRGRTGTTVPSPSRRPATQPAGKTIPH